MNTSQHKQAYVFHGRAGGCGNLYQNILQRGAAWKSNSKSQPWQRAGLEVSHLNTGLWCSCLQQVPVVAFA